MTRFADPFDAFASRKPPAPGMPLARPRSPLPGRGLPDLAALFAAPVGYEAYAGIGWRETPLDVCAEMTRIARALFERGFTLRSGHADRADQAFEAGVPDKSKAEIFLPWRRFNGSTSTLYPRDLALELQAEAIAEKYHPRWDLCSPGARSMHTRNVPQVLGQSLDRPARFVICYTEDGQASGGTGQAIRIARGYGVQVLNMQGAPMRAAVLQALGLTH